MQRDPWTHVIWKSGVAVVLCGLGNLAMAQSDSRAEVPRGLWQTEPNARGIIYHVRTRRCGRALCGRVERVKNRRGYDTPSNAVGQMVLAQMRSQPDGSFFGQVRGERGQIFDGARVDLIENALHLRVCQGQDCTTQVWERLR